jgi:hypothetical protein
MSFDEPVVADVLAALLALAGIDKDSAGTDMGTPDRVMKRMAAAAIGPA